jgi:hypothetical protein
MATFGARCARCSSSAWAAGRRTAPSPLSPIEPLTASHGSSSPATDSEARPGQWQPVSRGCRRQPLARAIAAGRQCTRTWTLLACAAATATAPGGGGDGGLSVIGCTVGPRTAGCPLDSGDRAPSSPPGAWCPGRCGPRRTTAPRESEEGGRGAEFGLRCWGPALLAEGLRGLLGPGRWRWTGQLRGLAPPAMPRATAGAAWSARQQRAASGRAAWFVCRYSLCAASVACFTRRGAIAVERLTQWME